jgi:hypothetical protein
MQNPQMFNTPVPDPLERIQYPPFGVHQIGCGM